MSRKMFQEHMSALPPRAFALSENEKYEDPAIELAYTAFMFGIEHARGAAMCVGVTFPSGDDEHGRLIAINTRAEEAEASLANEAHNFQNLCHISDYLTSKDLLLLNRNEEVDGPLAPALNIIDSIKAIQDKLGAITRDSILENLLLCSAEKTIKQARANFGTVKKMRQAFEELINSPTGSPLLEVDNDRRYKHKMVALLWYFFKSAYGVARKGYVTDQSWTNEHVLRQRTYIIGRIDMTQPQPKVFEFSPHPAIHRTFTKAKTELERLVAEHKSPFAIFAIASYLKPTEQGAEVEPTELQSEPTA